MTWPIIICSAMHGQGILDRVYVSQGLDGKASECNVKSFTPCTGYLSDHAPLVLELRGFRPAQAGVKVLRFDVSLLGDPAAVESVPKAVEGSLGTPGLVNQWDSLKSHCSALGERGSPDE